MIYFNSDYLEGAHPALMAKLNETNMVQTVGYGEDEYCAAAREKIKAACQAPDADVHFLVGGTLTNTTVIASVLRPYQGVLTAASGHINCHETGAIESSGHKVLALPTNNGKITAQQVEDYYNWHHFSPDYEHMVMPGMVYISFPTEGGTMYSKAELTALYEVCRKCGLPLFIDGARMGYGLTCDDCDLTLPELAQMSCMSVPSFCKKFKEQTKMTVTQYINEKRVAYAATLLKQSKYSLEEVAELAGFSNANYLLRVFKKSTGKTIGQYRKQIKF